MSGGKNPTRNYAIEYILRGAGLTIGQATAAAAAISTVTTADATGAVYGDVVGALLGPLLVQGIHGDELTKVLAADLDDWDPGTASLILRVDFAGFALSGMAAPDSPGEVRIIVAVTGGTLPHEDAGSTDVNRFLCSGGTDVTLDDDGLAIVLYDGTSTRWRVISGGASEAAAAGLVPYYIPVGETFTVALYRQALFSEPIEVDGALVVDGILIGVD